MLSLNTHTTLDEFFDFYQIQYGSVGPDRRCQLIPSVQMCLETAKLDIDPKVFGDRTKLAHFYKTMYFFNPGRKEWIEAFLIIQNEALKRHDGFDF